MKTMIIKNGRVIDPSQQLDALKTVVIRDGKIADILEPKAPTPEGEVIDATGCVVSPGFIDLHVHLRDPGQEYKEDIASGSLAAAAGGFTTICCMPNTDPVNDNGSVTSYILQKASEVAKVNVLPVGAISRGLKGELLADIGDMARLGAVAFSDDGRPVTNSALMRRAMEYADTFGRPIITHAEDLSLGKGVMNEGIVSTELGLAGIPHASEEIMIARDILLSEMTGAHLHIAHVSSARSVEMIREAKRRGDRVTAEVTPHHLILTDEAVRGYDPNTKMHPPLRTEKDRQALIEGLADGTIDVIATDHAPHAVVDKEVGFDSASFGIIGLETALPLGLKLVSEKKLTLQRLVESLTAAPAKVFNLNGKGNLCKGSDADVTIFKSKLPWTIDATALHSKSHNTPFLGFEVKGRVVATIVRGTVVLERGA